MITIVAEHEVKPDKLGEAFKIFDKISKTQTKAEGFISRQILISKKDPSKITTIATWISQEARDKWRETHPTSINSRVNNVFTRELIQTYEVLKSFSSSR